MANIERLRALIEPILTKMGYELVRVTFGGGERRATLQVMAERPETGQLVIEDCAEISRALSEMLDEVDPIPGEYHLEVSSPGIDRPLTRPKDFVTWAGHLARLNAKAPVDGRKRFSGTLLGLEGEDVLIETETGTARIPLSEVDTAKLVLTDALIEATMPEWRAEADAAAREAKDAKKKPKKADGKKSRAAAPDSGHNGPAQTANDDTDDTLENEDN
ncbi:ribosome maturation factor RimP [Sphingosinicellaceae bacterium A1X5R2]|nr:ribosome maturation factor RimP [Pedomonas mirosovicensis]MCH8684005.1 ribosome maturation factor RimP [Pedomonas mirosovicensis]